jgi:hypothetical protein
MPRYRWTVEFEAMDDKDADMQIQESILAFPDIYVEDVEQVEES